MERHQKDKEKLIQDIIHNWTEYEMAESIVFNYGPEEFQERLGQVEELENEDQS